MEALIVDLSSCSVNDGIDGSHCSLTYLTMDDNYCEESGRWKNLISRQLTVEGFWA